MDRLRRDLRFALRSLARSPGFTAAAVLTLGLGIGATTAIFSAVDAVVLEPLELPEPDELYTVWHDLSGRGGPEAEWLGRSIFDAWRRSAESFEGMTVVAGWAPSFTGGDRPETFTGAVVSHEYFRILGVEPTLGRGFRAEEEAPGRSRVVVLSHGLWSRRFGSDPAIVGESLVLAGEPHTVVGVAPEGLEAPLQPDVELWSVLTFRPEPQDWGGFYLRSIGRLRDGVSAAAADAELDAITARLGEEHPTDLADTAATLVPLRRSVAGPAREPMLALLGAVVLVLLIACANVANLLLVRASDRERELAIRTALGAGRSQIVRQLLTESLVLAALGGGLGLVLSAWGVDLLRRFAPAGTPRVDRIALDGPVLLFALAATAATGLLFGLAPVLAAARRRLAGGLGDGGRGGASGGKARARRVLVVAELALGLALLAGAGLLLRSVLALQDVDPGFEPEGVVAARVILPSAEYPEDHRLAGFVAGVVRRLAERGGVEAAGAVSELPLSGGQHDLSFVVEGRIPPAGEEPAADYRAVAPGYFRTLGIPLRSGRRFDAGDDAGASRVALVNTTFAERYFPAEDPVGRRLRIGNTRDPEAPWWTVVGVVGGVRDNALGRPPDAEMYVPVAQRPPRAVWVVARGKAGEDALGAALRDAIWEVAPDQAILRTTPMGDLVRASLAPSRFFAGLLATFATLALVLAAVGVYGVMAYAVARRTREIGVRMALGARRGTVLAMVLREGGLLAALGLSLGFALAWSLGEALSSLLYGVDARDPATLAAVAAVLAVTALAASAVPARRAAKIEPVVALGEE